MAEWQSQGLLYDSIVADRVSIEESDITQSLVQVILDQEKADTWQVYHAFTTDENTTTYLSITELSE